MRVQMLQSLRRRLRMVRPALRMHRADAVGQLLTLSFSPSAPNCTCTCDACTVWIGSMLHTFNIVTAPLLRPASLPAVQYCEGLQMRWKQTWRWCLMRTTCHPHCPQSSQRHLQQHHCWWLQQRCLKRGSASRNVGDSKHLLHLHLMTWRRSWQTCDAFRARQQ